MTLRGCGLSLIIASIGVCARASGAETYVAPASDTVAYTSDVGPVDAHYDIPDTDMPFISINTDMRGDMNWAAALEFTDPALRPVPVTLPFLEGYPMDNLEIKLRVFNVKF